MKFVIECGGFFVAEDSKPVHFCEKREGAHEFSSDLVAWEAVDRLGLKPGEVTLCPQGNGN